MGTYRVERIFIQQLDMKKKEERKKKNNINIEHFNR